MNTQTHKNLVQEWYSIFGDDCDLDQNLGDGVFPTINEYIAMGVSPTTYHQWYEVGGWDIEKMIELVTNDIPIDELGIMTMEGWGNYYHTLAYKYSNGDLSLEEVKRILDK